MSQPDNLTLDSPDGVITAARLRQVMKYERNGALRRRLCKEGIAFFEGADGPWTTTELVKAAGLAKMGLTVPNENNQGSKKKWI